MSQPKKKSPGKAKSPQPREASGAGAPSPKRPRVTITNRSEDSASQSEASGTEDISEKDDGSSDMEETETQQAPVSQPGSPTPSPDPYEDSPWHQFVYGDEALPFPKLRDLARLAVPAIPKTALPKTESKKNRGTILEILANHRQAGPAMKECAFICGSSPTPSPPSSTFTGSPVPEPASDSLRDLIATLRQDLRQEMQNTLAAANERVSPPVIPDPIILTAKQYQERHRTPSTPGDQFLQEAQTRRNAASSAATISAARTTFPQQATAGVAIPSRVGERAREAVLEGKYLPAQYYYGRPLHLASDFTPEKRTSLGANSDGEAILLISTSSSSTKSALPQPIENEFSLTLAVNNWLLCVASLRPDKVNDALLLASDVMFFLDEYRCWQGAQSYFDEIRRNRAIDGYESHIPLGQRDGFLFTKCALDTSHLHQGNRRYVGAPKRGNNNNTPNQEASKKNYCIQWNKGKCNRGDSCFYLHKCKFCDGSHQSKDCKPGNQGSSSSTATTPPTRNSSRNTASNEGNPSS